MLRALETTEPLDRYLELKAEIEALKEQLDELKPLITDALWEEPEHFTIYRGCEIRLGTRDSYEYSEHLQAMKRELRALKAAERANGTAELKRSTSFPIVKALQTAD